MRISEGLDRTLIRKGSDEISYKGLKSSWLKDEVVKKNRVGISVIPK